MKLLASLTSPYARKLRILALELDLDVELVETAPMADAPDFLAVNPLGKVPALLVGDDAIVDSRVIAGYLLALAPGNAILPDAGPAHWHGRTTEAIADGILDAAITLRFNAGQGVTSGLWVDRQYRAIDRAVLALAGRVGDGCAGEFGWGEISTVVAVEYLDLRWPMIDWRATAPGLATLQACHCDRAAMISTRPPQ